MKLILSALFVLASVAVLAQSAPQKMNYQAVARNSAGVTLVNQTIAVKAEIIDANLTTVLYAETHSTTTNQFGLFTLQIGTGTVVSGTFATINWGAGDKYIRTSVDLTGGTNYQLMGMSQLLSVPYALYAAKTNLVSGNAISITNGNTIAANYTAGTGININGSIISATTGSKWTNDTYGIYYQNSNGGIGVGGGTESGSSLTSTQTSVFGTGAAAAFKGANAWQTAVRFDNSNSGKSYALNVAGLSNTAQPTGSFSLFNSTANNFVWNTDGTNSSFLAIGSNSNVASTPKSRLHVFSGDVNIEQIGSGIILKSPNGACWRITIDNTGNLVRTAITCP